MRTFLLSVLLSVMPVMAADVYSFGVLPGDGSIGAAPGATTGWGYTIENQSNSLWLVTTGLTSGGFQYGTPNLIFDFPDVAPGEAVTVSFDPVTSAGLEEFTWDTSAPLGFVNSGNFSLEAQWWSGDPLGGGGFVSDAPSATQFYSVTAIATAAPEPATNMLVAAAFLLLGFTKVLRHRSRSHVSLIEKESHPGNSFPRRSWI